MIIILNNEVLASSYKLYCHDHADGYGGALVGIKSNNHYHLKFDCCTIRSRELYCFITVIMEPLFCVYRSPNTDTLYLTNLCGYAITLSHKYHDAIICCTGNFNLPDIRSLIHMWPLAINEFN